MSTTLRPDGLSPDRLAALEEERDFLLRSLADLDAERAAGDIDEDDFQALSDDYTARTAEVLRAIDEHRDSVEATRPRTRPMRIALVVAGVAAVAVVAGVLVAQAAGRREPGQTITGSAPTTSTQEARRCINVKAADAAVTCYRAVLDKDPKNATALTYLGWTVYLGSQGSPNATDRKAGLDAANGLLDRAVAATPDFADAYAFRAVIAFQNGDTPGAAKALDRVDALDPPASVKQLIGPLRDEIDKKLRATTTSTSTTPP